MSPITNFKDNFGADLGLKLITKDYLLSVYPSIAQQIGIPPELWIWGNGSSGQLGTNDILNVSIPGTTILGGSNWRQISDGAFHTTAIKTDGTLWTWGNGSYGQLGTNDLTNRSIPVTTFSGGNNWIQVSGGNQHTAAVKTDGTLWVWGNGTSGQLGTNDINNRRTPVTTFAGGTDWKQVSCGGNYTTAIKTDGTLWAWGINDVGQLGTNDTITRSTPVTTLTDGTNWKQVSAGNSHTTAIKADGTLWTWGNSFSGQLGTNDVINRSTPTTTFIGGTNWKQISNGSFHTAAIKIDGSLWIWGSGSYGQLGTNNTISRSTPITTFTGGINWKQVSGGGRHTAAIKTDGTLWIWGNGTSGQLGNNNLTNISTPVTTFAGGTNWKQVSLGDNHTVAIESVDFAS